LTLAVKAVTNKGIVVVAAAGNMGKNAQGHLQWGGITAPANAPWVLTVGASSTMGTNTRNDDTMAAFSSSGPSYVDFEAKPDLVAPGTGTISLAVPGSLFYATKAQYLLAGKAGLGVKPYLSLRGTSMAAPALTGTVRRLRRRLAARTATTSRGARRRTATTSCRAPPMTATTSSGARLATATTSCGARPTATTSCGAPTVAAPTATTSCGARRMATTSCG